QVVVYVVFFFQAEDGIRDKLVTGVQTCALPICPGGCDIHAAFDSPTGLIYPAMDTGNLTLRTNSIAHEVLVDQNSGKARGISFRSEERRVGKECRSRWARYH